MAHQKAAWGIEIGAYAIKAIRLERDGDAVSVSDFAVIPHKKVLTSPDLDQDEMIRLGLGQFISQKSLEGEHLVMSVPGHTAFARFAKLPPVDPKKVPDIVKFEAVQQIPFPIDQVEWDYQTFTSPDTPEIEVGIFAIMRERIQQRLGLYGELGLSPEVMTLSPVALYNAMVYDRGDELKKQPVLFVDIGTSATDVVVADGNRCWIRTFPLGGTHFTDAIAGAFKLSYSKAEKLKLEATSSKYAKQIMQAMRPVFSDLLQDLQRSIGYYQSLNRDANLTTMVGVGSTFKIPGLRKFLGQQLQIDVIRLDEYRKLAVTGREAAAFAENAVNMATAYGLALQGVGLASITANVVPTKTLRDQMWQSKTKWFAAAAAIAIIGSAALLIRPLTDGRKLSPGGVPAVVQTTITQGNQYRQRYETAKAQSDIGHSAANMLNLLDHREVWPHIVNDAGLALAAAGPQAELLGPDVAKIMEIPPDDRKLVSLEQLGADYIPPTETTKRRFKVTMNISLSHEKPEEFVNNTVAKWLRDNAEREMLPYRIITDTISINPSQLVTKKIEEGGKVKVEGGSSPGGNAPSAGGSSPPAPGGRGGGDGAPQGGGGLRDRGGSTITAPGGGLGALSAGGAGGSGRGPAGSSTAPPPPTAPRTGSTASDPSGTSGEGENIDFRNVAPVPGRPLLYPPGTTIFELPVTFEVELLDPAAPGATASPETVAGSGSNNGAEAATS